MSQFHDRLAQQDYIPSSLIPEIAEEMQHEELEPFISGPLEVPADGRRSYFPQGYCPPSFGKQRSRHLPLGSYSGKVVLGKPDGFGCCHWGQIRKFDGKWQGGLEHGVGREAWCTGSSYSGGFSYGLRSGFGVYSHCASPDMFQILKLPAGPLGKMFEWTKTLPYSQKWGTAQSGWVYAGQMRYGGRHGFGALATAGGELYEGQFNEDKKHGFGVRLVGNKDLFLEEHNDGECRMSYNPLLHEGFTVHVEASLNRLRWSAVKFCLYWQNGVASITMMDKMSGSLLGSKIVISDVMSLKVGDPITHSFILQYTDSENLKKTMEIQAGSDATFRLLFLALRIAIYEYRVGQPLRKPVNADWFKDLSGDDPGRLLGRFVRGSEGLDERFFQKVRESVARADAEHRKAFNFTCLTYVKMAVSVSSYLHTVWAVDREHTFQVTCQEFADPDQWLQDQSTNSSKEDEEGSSANATKEAVTEVLLDRTIVFLRRCDSLITSRMEQSEQKRGQMLAANDKSAAKIHEARLSLLQAKQRWASESVPILEQGAEFVHYGLLSCFAHLSFNLAEIVAATAIGEDPIKTPSPSSGKSPDSTTRSAPPPAASEQQENSTSARTKYVANDLTHGIMMRRSAITTAMLVQSRRQREMVDLEYAEAEKLLKDAKCQLEQSQAAQRAITLEMKQRAEIAEAEHAKLQKLYAQAMMELHEHIAINEHLLRLNEGLKQRTIQTLRKRLERLLLRNALGLWRENVRLMSTVRSVLRKVKNFKLWRVWETWNEATEHGKKVRAIIMRSLGRWKNQSLMSAWDLWNYQIPRNNLEYQTEKRLMTEEQLGQLVQDHQGLLARLLKAEDELQRHRDRLTFLNTKSHAAAEHLLMRLMKRGLMMFFEKWRENSCDIRRHMIIIFKIKARWRYRFLIFTFQKWFQDIHEDKRRLRIIYIVKVRWTKQMLRRSWQCLGVSCGVLPGYWKDVHQKWGLLASRSCGAEGELKAYQIFDESLRVNIGHLNGLFSEETLVVKSKKAKSARSAAPGRKKITPTGAEVEDDFPLQSLDSTSRVSETFVRLWGEEAVPFKLTLDMDFNSIKDTEAFKKDVQKDVATAAKIEIKHVRVIGLRAGSVVDMLIASEAGDAQAIVQDLEEQIKTPNSLLMQGKMTSKTKKDPYYCQPITYCTQWNTIIFEADKPVALVKCAGKGIQRFRRAVRSIMMARRFQGAACKIGVAISNDPPHKVLKVTELMDANGILQGQPGYSNPIVCQGDVMYEINGERIGTTSHNGARKVRDLLFGPPNSRVKLQFQRQDGSTYDVTALRHVPKTEAGIIAAKFDKVDQRQPQRSYIGAGFSSSPPDPSHNAIYRSSDSMQTPLHRPPSALPGNNNFFMDAMHSVGSILLPPTKSPQMASANDPKYMSPYQMIPSTPPVSENYGKTAIYLPPSASSYGYGSVGYGNVSASGTVQTAAVSTHGGMPVYQQGLSRTSSPWPSPPKQQYSQMTPASSVPDYMAGGYQVTQGSALPDYGTISNNEVLF